MLQAFCYDAPKTELVVPDFAPTTGGINVTIVGANFDVNVRPADAQIGDTAAEATSV